MSWDLDIVSAHFTRSHYVYTSIYILSLQVYVSVLFSKPMNESAKWVRSEAVSFSFHFPARLMVAARSLIFGPTRTSPGLFTPQICRKMWGVYVLMMSCKICLCCAYTARASDSVMIRHCVSLSFCCLPLCCHRVGLDSLCLWYCFHRTVGVFICAFVYFHVAEAGEFSPICCYGKTRENWF